MTTAGVLAAILAAAHGDCRKQEAAQVYHVGVKCAEAGVNWCGWFEVDSSLDVGWIRRISQSPAS